MASAAAARPAIEAGANDARNVIRWLALMLFASIFLQRFALPFSDGIALNMFVTLAAVAVLAVHGALAVDLVRAALFFVFACCMSLSVVANANDASINSVKLVMLLYAPFVLSLRAPKEDVFPACIRIFQKMILISAVCGIAQYLGQFAFSGADLFSFDGLVPDDFLVPHYNTVIPLSWGSTTYKSNGFFLP